MLFMLACLVLKFQASETGPYPTYMWTKNIKGKKIEMKPQVSANGEITPTLGSEVAEEVRKIIDTTNANSFIIYNKPGMNTGSLVNTLVNNEKISTLLKGATYNALERSFTDVSGESVAFELTKKFENVKSVTIDSKEALEELKKEFATTPKPFIHQYYIIDLPVDKENTFDELVFQIEQAFQKRSFGNHVSALTGSPLDQRRLQEVDVEPTVLRSTKKVGDDEEFQFVTANILTKTLISLPIVFLLIAAMLMMFNIKTPTLFVEKGIDFGKIEK